MTFDQVSTFFENNQKFFLQFSVTISRLQIRALNIIILIANVEIILISNVQLKSLVKS